MLSIQVSHFDRAMAGPRERGPDVQGYGGAGQLHVLLEEEHHPHPHCQALQAKPHPERHSRADSNSVFPSHPTPSSTFGEIRKLF